MPKKHITVPVFVPHMGCPHKCAFCNQNLQTNRDEAHTDIDALVKLYRSRSPESVDCFELAFFGGSFTAIETGKKTALLSQGKKCIDAGLVSSIRISTRPDCITEEELDLLKTYGVKTIELGAQSFSQSVLDASYRGHSVNDIIESSKHIKARGFNLVLQLLPGLPEDTRQLAIMSAREAAKLAPDAVRIYPAVVFSGTRLENMMSKREYAPPTLDEAVDICAGMYEIFENAGIPVIRTGIHPLENGSEKSIIAGAYHPSMGFLVKSRVRRNLLERIISPLKGSVILVSLPFNGKEEFIGPRRENITYLQKKFGTIQIKYIPGNIPSAAAI